MFRALIPLIFLTGCAGYQRYDTSSPKYQQCQYEAELATPGTNNPFTDVMRKTDLTQMCMKRP